MTQDSREFDCLRSRLERVNFIEASAGTGKTYTLQRLVLRLLVEKAMPLEQILIVTFTRAATAELKERLRAILTEALAVLEPDGSGGFKPSEGTLGDSSARGLLQLYEKWRGEEKIDFKAARGRITAALENFDEASVYTIHSFCQKMLLSFAFSGGTAFETTLDEDPSIMNRVVEDFKRGRLAGEALRDSPEDQQKLIGFNGRQLLDQLRQHPGSTKNLSFPDWSPGLEGTLSEFADQVPGLVREAKRREGVMSFDDILQDMLQSAQTSKAFRDSVRRQFRAVLVDEFQDTDELQYSIFKTIFLDPEDNDETAVFVGDPKQSIYRFRGAQIEVYLRARDEAARSGFAPWSLGTNYRSTPPAVDAVNVLFSTPDGASRFSKGISFPLVKSSASRLPLFRKNPESGKLEPVRAFELWTGRWEAPSDWKEGDGVERLIKADTAREYEARLIASDISSLLSSETYVGARLSDPGVSLEEARLKPGDIAVLVRNHDNSAALERELAARGIGTLHMTRDDVFLTPEARDVLAVMRAVSDPVDRAVVNAARATPICGRKLSELIESEPEAGEEKTEKEKKVEDLYLEDLKLFREASARCERYGFASAFSFLFEKFGTVGRALSSPGGDRSLTNWGQVVELLHAQYERVKSMSSLVQEFERTLDGLASKGSSSYASKPDSPVERQLRVESDASLVRIETVFGSKGLEYPVVYLAGAFSYCQGNKQDPLLLPAAEGGWEYLQSPRKGDRAEETIRGIREELVRIAYVGATRGSARVVLPLPVVYKRVKEGIYHFVSTRSVWIDLLKAGPRPEAKNPEARKKTGKGRSSASKEDGLLAAEMTQGLSDFEARLKSESSFAHDPGVRSGMAAALRKGKTGDGPRSAIVEEAAESLERCPEGEPLAAVLYPKDPLLEPAGRAVSICAKPSSSEDALAGAQAAGPLIRPWRSSSYSSIARGFELSLPGIPDEREPDEAYAEEAEGEEQAAPDLFQNPAFLAGGKDTGDAVHNLFEESIRSDLHRSEGFLESGSGFKRVFDAAKGSSLLARKVRHEAGEEPDPKKDREDAVSWVSDRIRGVFSTPLWSGDDAFRIADAPEGCAVPELPFALTVGEGVTAEGFARKILELNRKAPAEKRLPLADLEPSAARTVLRGYLEGRIDLLAQDASGLFWLVDWKTDQPGDRSARSYCASAMMDVMLEAKYGWQALFYLTALQRMISEAWGIGPEEAVGRIGGMAYVFIRGFSAAAPAAEPAAVVLRPDPRIILESGRLLGGEKAK
ncbi:UvrD-helicase domain-containing protein [Mesosutterella sp. OilRF-GAM-744-9]|uniref:RecBCD enzyme subunit RecB n=1 Tax=Mesosutterella porci TaxID=2915351 RepID=A0ABS9MNB6_9BURK|nr:UvrD-helicase domain-containing protein [Mesosutterella sp. oilRF-744-WT-GAM-9]MCG5030115.1 UvrD-helicase domain-containing protein [Mesosutterella sp. oilRF-744-WT-GAM-9]